MKLFPHILARVGGATFSKVEALSFEKMSFVNTLLHMESKLEFQFEKVLQNFQATSENSKDYRLRAILNNGKKDFKNQRFSFLKKIEKANQNEILNDLLFNISIYTDWKLELENLKSEFDLIFKKEELFQYSFIRDFFQEEDIQKGLLQSSHSLYHQNKKLASKEPEDFRKKERQTLRALAQYFYRIGTKTSPFSHFTTLDLLSEKDGFFRTENLKTEYPSFQFNNFILAEMKDLLLEEPSFFRQLKLKINPTISVRDNEFYFIKNFKNVETIQQIESSVILEKLSQTIIPKEGVDFKNAVVELLELVEADQESIENYLLELIELGFLEWHWGFSGLSFDWVDKFLKVISSMDDFLNKIEWIVCLEKMMTFRTQLDFIDAEARFDIQKYLVQDLNKLGLKNIIPELMFFEDVQKSTSVQLSKKEFTPIIQSLDSLLRMIELLMEGQFKNKILNCWTQNFKSEKSVSLICFYKKFYQTPFDNKTFTNNKSEVLLKEIKLKVKEKGKIDEKGNLRFSTEDLKNIFSEENKNSSSQYSGLFQFYKSDGKIKAVINGLIPGYGKLFGRFLPLFDSEITIHLQKCNFEIMNNDLWVENVDASIFNANLHPSLLDFEIRNSNSQNNLPIENQIPINEMEVTWDDDAQAPILVFSKFNEKVSILDFGFEHPDNRSPMFQLLNGFGIPHATYRFFTKLVNELFFDEKPNEIRCFRRIVIDDHLILQRQYQEVPNSFFPQKEKNETNSSYFLKMQKWKRENDIPPFIFIQSIRDTENLNSNLNRDFFKPQLIDLNSPIAIVLLQKVLEKHSGKIRIVEMLPNGDKMIGDSVAEFAIQWRLND